MVTSRGQRVHLAGDLEAAREQEELIHAADRPNGPSTRSRGSSMRGSSLTVY
jgi:hypothetical protein